MSEETTSLEKQGKPDVQAIMARIRDEVKEGLDTPGEKQAWRPPLLRTSAELKSPMTPVLYSEELNYLNANWSNWMSPVDISSHRKILGPLIVRVKQAFADFLFHVVFRGYFDKQREFNMNLIRFLNSTAKYIDARDAEIFWQLVAKIDADIVAVNDRLDRIYDEAVASIRTLELEITKRVSLVEADRDILVEVANKTQDSISELDQLIRGVERVVALAARPLTVDAALQPSADGESDAPRRPGNGQVSLPAGIDYLLLENRFRGTEPVIKERMREYLDQFLATSGPSSGVVLDIGCGRGEFLELLREAGIDSFGIDLNEAMVAHCRQKGLSVLKADLLDYLEQLPDHSLRGIFAAQVVEHLTREQLDRFITLAAQKVKIGGKILFETINPQSIVALARNFFRDPTHIWPLHPDTLRFMFEMRGIKTANVLMRSAFPQQAIFQKLELSDSLPARWRAMLQLINNNIDRLNELMYGHQDFCIVGEIEEARTGRSVAADETITGSRIEETSVSTAGELS